MYFYVCVDLNDVIYFRFLYIYMNKMEEVSYFQWHRLMSGIEKVPQCSPRAGEKRREREKNSQKNENDSTTQRL